MRKIIHLFIAICGMPAAFAGLETPVPGSAESGLGLIRGWVCDAAEVTVSIDGKVPKVIAYGNRRVDTQSVCGDTDNGFETLQNWSILGNGQHSVTVYADGLEIGNSTFNVATLSMGSDYVRGLSAEYTLTDFPEPGRDTVVTWSEDTQNFKITSVSAVASLPISFSFDYLRGKVFYVVREETPTVDAYEFDQNYLSYDYYGYEGTNYDDRRFYGYNYYTITSNYESAREGQLTVLLGDDWEPHYYRIVGGVVSEYLRVEDTYDLAVKGYFRFYYDLDQAIQYASQYQ